MRWRRQKNDAERLKPPHVLPDEEYWNTVDGRHFDRQGRALSRRDWSRLFSYSDDDGVPYQRIALDLVGDYRISTVWLGLDHNFYGGAPLIFETIVLNDSYPDIPPIEDVLDPDKELPEYTKATDLDCDRYSTEEEARAGHARMVEKVRLIQDAMVR